MAVKTLIVVYLTLQVGGKPPVTFSPSTEIFLDGNSTCSEQVEHWVENFVDTVVTTANSVRPVKLIEYSYGDQCK